MFFERAVAFPTLFVEDFFYRYFVHDACLVECAPKTVVSILASSSVPSMYLAIVCAVTALKLKYFIMSDLNFRLP